MSTLDLDESYVDVDNVIDKLFEHIWNEVQNGTIIKRLGRKNTITLFDYSDSLGESFLIRFNKKPYFRFLIRYKMDSQNHPLDILMSGYFRNRYQSYFFGGNLFLGDTKLRTIMYGAGIINFKNKKFAVNHSQDIFLVDLPQEKNLRMMLLLKESFSLDLNKLDLQNARCSNCDSFMSHQLGVGFVFKDKAELSNIYLGLTGGINIDLKEGDLFPIISISISLLPAE